MSINKRLFKEVSRIYNEQNGKDLLDNDYIIYFDESNMQKISAMIKAPQDSVYRHKFIRLDFVIPDNYPHSPPQVFFVNHDAVRIHPNMYEDGKCCSTILNTWGDNIFEKWTSSMGIETILITFHSFLDNHPYTYEPGGGDNPTYTVFVEHQTWYTCLLRYLQFESISPFRAFMTRYLIFHFEDIHKDLTELEIEYPKGTYYTPCFEIDDYIIDYGRIKYLLEYQLQIADFGYDSDSDADSGGDIGVEIEPHATGEYQCNICFDSVCATNTTVNISTIVLDCGHSFHANCLKAHTQTNHKMCSLCRRELTTQELEKIVKESGEWIINPLTKRRVKIGSRTWYYLLENNVKLA